MELDRNFSEKRKWICYFLVVLWIVSESFTDAMLNVHTEQPQSLETFDESVEK